MKQIAMFTDVKNLLEFKSMSSQRSLAIDSQNIVSFQLNADMPEIQEQIRFGFFERVYLMPLLSPPLVHSPFFFHFPSDDPQQTGYWRRMMMLIKMSFRINFTYSILRKKGPAIISISKGYTWLSYLDKKK